MKVNLLLITIFSITLTSCRPQPSNEGTSTNETLSGGDVNTTINVVVPQEWNTFKLSDAVALDVVLKTNHTVLLDDHNVKINMNKDNGWVSVENQNPHPSNIYIIEPTGASAFRSAEVIVIPSIDQQSDPILLRIVVLANIYDNKVMGKQVSAHVDVTLQP